MSPSATTPSATGLDTVTKEGSANEEFFTLPNLSSNVPRGGLLNGSVMLAEPNPLGLGPRSGGPCELQKAGGVTGGVAAAQAPPPGATLAVCNPARQAMPDTQHGAPTMSVVTEASCADDDESNETDKKPATETNPWKAWIVGKTDKVGNEVAASSVYVDSEPMVLERAEAFEIVKAARSILQTQNQDRLARKDTPASPASLADYAKKCRQIDAELVDLEPGSPNPLLEVMSRHTARKPTFSVLKTALKSRSLARVSALLTQQDALQRAQPQGMAWTRAVRELQRAMQEVQTITALTWQNCQEFSGTKVRASMSKKACLHKLPEGWQDRFLALNQSSPKYRIAGVLLRHCGLRPKELATGVILEATADGVSVRIEGAKVRETAGQPWRQFMLQIQVLPEWFVSAVSLQASTVVRVSEDGLRAHLGRLSEPVFNSNANGKAKRSKQARRFCRRTCFAMHWSRSCEWPVGAAKRLRR